jgi:hypothetical protein
MPFPRLYLREAAPPRPGLPTRADIALFVGLVGRSALPVPPEVRDWLTQAGWAGSGPFARPPAAVEALLDVPVPVESWGAFERLFAWDGRPVEVGSAQTIPARLGLAVRTFFAEGGAKAYVVRTGDPLPLLTGQAPDQAAAAKRKLISWANAAPPADAAARVPLIPGFGDLGTRGEATAPATWHGVEHVWGVEEAAMLLLPDLPELFAGAPAPIPDLPQPPAPPEDFKPCAPALSDTAPPRRAGRPAVMAPRLDRAGYRDWAKAITSLLALLAVPRGSAHRRDVMLLASLPLPVPAADGVPARSEAWPLALLDAMGIASPPNRLLDGVVIGSARLQLAYPWLETDGSAVLPEGVEGPEGVLAGAIARTALALGAFRSAAGTSLATVRRALPELGTGDLERGLPDGRAGWLGDRLSLVAAKVGGFVLLSDATAAADRMWRAAGVSRLMGIILRAARWLGQDRIFDPAGPALWAGMRGDLENFLEQLRQRGALAGATPDDAYSVRCDASTMSQADIDAGRTIVSIGFNAAQPIEWISVTLALGGPADAPQQVAA